MLKNNKWKIIISSLITVLPIFAGLFLWDRLPESMVSHWDESLTPDGMSSKPFVVFALPLILLVVYWLCLFATSFDKKQKEQSPKALGIVYWSMPVISLFSNGVIYATALGKTLSVEILLPVLFGLMFIFIGNYLPKTKPNRTLGIRIYYTMANEENWFRTHRYAGRLWVSGGLIILFSALLPFKAMIYVVAASLTTLIIAPLIYSYKIYAWHKKNGIEYNKNTKTKFDKTASKISAIVVPVILVLTLALMITGEIDASINENTLEIKASYFDDITLDLDKIESVEYSEDKVSGMRVYGFGSARLSMGTFKNDEFGNYTRYTYNKTNEAIIIKSQGKILVLNLSTSDETRELYNTLIERT